MHVGHINLATSVNGAGEHFVRLVESLQQAGVKQHLVLRSEALAKRLAAVDGVEVAPLVRSAIVASCMMPRLDVVHIHDADSAQAGLLLTLTRSIPYVLSHSEAAIRGGPLTQSILRRARCIICQDDSEASIVRHYDPRLRVEVLAPVQYQDKADNWLRVYQNSQSTPTAGKSGIQ